MKAYGGVKLYIDIFLTSELVGGEWSASRFIVPYSKRNSRTQRFGNDLFPKRCVHLCFLEYQTMAEVQAPSNSDSKRELGGTSGKHSSY
jgi:hypothetical protein